MIQPLLDHVKLAVGRSEEHFKLILDHAADSVQNLHKRYPKVWVINGRQGTGKSMLLDVMFEPVFGTDDPNANRGHGGQGMFASFRDSHQVLRDSLATLHLAARSSCLMMRRVTVI